MKTFNFISNITNGSGLQREYEFTRGLLESYGHKVNGVMHTDPNPPQADINLFDEVVSPVALNRAKQNWLMPHSEWWSDSAWGRYLPQFSKIICKTWDCYRIWTGKVPAEKCVYTGFESLDLYDPTVEKQNTFLHMPGGSRTRQSKAVADAWRGWRSPYQLTVVTRLDEVADYFYDLENVTVLRRQSDGDLKFLLNSNRFVIIPSRYEGFGHALHEAVGCGAVVLTTNAPPMNSFNGIADEALIKVVRQEPWCSATANYVSAETVFEAALRVGRLSQMRLDILSEDARQAFLFDREDFRARFRVLMEGL